VQAAQKQGQERYRVTASTALPGQLHALPQRSTEALNCPDRDAFSASISSFSRLLWWSRRDPLTPRPIMYLCPDDEAQSGCYVPCSQPDFTRVAKLGQNNMNPNSDILLHKNSFGLTFTSRSRREKPVKTGRYMLRSERFLAGIATRTTVLGLNSSRNKGRDK
jgi:hypothetical protein